jgi:hypothetical protein
MLKTYENYVDGASADEEFKVICEIDEDEIVAISGQDNVNDAIETEFGWVESMFLRDHKKLDNGQYECDIIVSKDILSKTEEKDLENAIRSEFEWLVQSGIKLIQIL